MEFFKFSIKQNKVGLNYIIQKYLYGMLVGVLWPNVCYNEKMKFYTAPKKKIKL